MLPKASGDRTWGCLPENHRELWHDKTKHSLYHKVLERKDEGLAALFHPEKGVSSATKAPRRRQRNGKPPSFILSSRPTVST